MRENRHFVRSTDVSGREPTLIGGEPSVNSYHALIDRIEKLAGRDAAALFAEPVLPRDTARGNTLSWYCVREGSVLEVEAIDEIARRPVVEKLATRLAALAPALNDPEIGPAVGTWLNIAGPTDILSVGGEPVIVDWGFLPAGVAADPAAHGDHFARTLGRFVPALGLPPVTAARVASGVEEPPPPPRRNEEEKASAMAPAPPPPPPPEYSPPQQADHRSGEPPLPPMPPTPQGAPPSRPWLTPVIACAAAAVALLFLLLPGVLKFPEKDSAAREAAELARLQANNDSLEAQLKALQDAAHDKVCRANDAVIQVPDKSRPDAPPSKMEIVPRPPDKVPLPGNTETDASKNTVATLLDAATVMVFALTADEDKSSQGTGFFINDHTIVTNRHVVENMDPNEIFVASHALGGIHRAKLVTRSDREIVEGQIGIDFAILELIEGTSKAVLPVGATPAKLSTVYIAGFPGFIVRGDVNFQNFLTKLGEAHRKGGNLDEELRAQGPVEVPSPDMRYGRVNNIIRAGEQAFPLILHDMQIAPGNSGGPLVDACGRIAGVNTWTQRNKNDVQQANLAQDVTTLRQFLKDQNISFTNDESACSGTPPVAQTVPPPPPPK